MYYQKNSECPGQIMLVRRLILTFIVRLYVRFDLACVIRALDNDVNPCPTEPGYTLPLQTV